MRCKPFAVLAAFAVSLALTLSISAESTEVEISDLYENGTEESAVTTGIEISDLYENGTDNTTVTTDVEISDLYENETYETLESSGFFYDSETQLYRYEFENGEKLFATAPLSAKNAVPYMWLSWSENVEAVVLLNGEDVGFTNGDMLTESGNYSVYAVSDSETKQFNFAIQSGVTVTDSRFEGKITDGLFLADGITSNVLDGETITFPAEITADSDYICTVIKNGSAETMSGKLYFAEDGTYNITFTDVTSGRICRLSFVIMQKTSSKAELFTAPKGFEITSASLDGEEIPKGETLVLDRDGEYTITYSSGEITRTMSFTRDTKAPKLYFNGTQNITFGEPVKITADGDYRYEILKDGFVYDMYDNTLSASGIYRVNATDNAGNSVTRRVIIEAKSGIAPMGIIISCAAVLAIIVGYFIYHKTHPLRVK